MKYIIEKNSKKPAYLQLYAQLRGDIVKGVYPPGSRLPSKRTVSEETGISTVTAEHAFALLCDEGYAEARQRSGYYVIFSRDDGFSEPPASVFGSISRPHRQISQETSFPFSVLARTMRSVISAYGESVLERTPGKGTVELREAVRQYLARSRGITADTGQIIIGAGSEYIYRLITALLGRDKVYAIETPSYQKIEQIYSLEGVVTEKLPLGPDGIESTALRNSRADVLHISPYRSFPSGITASASKKHEYVRWALEGGRIIIEDDFESEFTILKKSEETLFSLSPQNVIYINTFSKTVSPALRTAYVVLPKELAAEFDKKLGFYSCTVSAYIQYVLAELINSGDFERHINRVRRKKRKESGQDRLNSANI